jgi:hypothetical protein
MRAPERMRMKEVTLVIVRAIIIVEVEKKFKTT